MAKRIKVTKSKNSESYSIIDDYTHPQTKKRSTFVVESLGSLNSLKEKLGTDSKQVVLDYINTYVEQLRLLDRQANPLLFSLHSYL